MCLFLENRPEVFRNKEKSDDICNLFSNGYEKNNINLSVYVCVCRERERKRQRQFDKISTIGS